MGMAKLSLVKLERFVDLDSECFTPRNPTKRRKDEACDFLYFRYYNHKFVLISIIGLPED
jgi:hypothetical protein